MRSETKVVPQDLYHIFPTTAPSDIRMGSTVRLLPGQPPVNLKHSVLEHC